MSNALAIAAVTATLQAAITRALKAPLPAGMPPQLLPTKQVQVTALPIDRVRTQWPADNVVNLFLYSTVPNAAYRNAVAPGGSTTGDPGPLALKLQYMLTAFGEDDNDAIAQLLIGRAMLALHDSPVLSPADLADALGASGLQDQIERVRVTPHALDFEEMSKLWAAYQTQYRLSAAYEASTVLIESLRVRTTAPPVRTANVVADSFERPWIGTVSPSVVDPGATLTITGRNLGDPAIGVAIGDAPVPPATRSANRLTVVLPAGTYAGLNAVRVIQPVPLGIPPVVHAGVGFESNALPFTLTPAITDAGPLTVARGANLALNVAPPLGVGQRVLLSLGGVQLPMVPRALGSTGDVATATFVVPAAFATGTFVARILVDGASSVPTIDADPQSATAGTEIAPQVKVT